MLVNALLPPSPPPSTTGTRCFFIDYITICPTLNEHSFDIFARRNKNFSHTLVSSCFSWSWLPFVYRWGYNSCIYIITTVHWIYKKYVVNWSLLVILLFALVDVVYRIMEIKRLHQPLNNAIKDFPIIYRRQTVCEKCVDVKRFSEQLHSFSFAYVHHICTI